MRPREAQFMIVTLVAMFWCLAISDRWLFMTPFAGPSAFFVVTACEAIDKRWRRYKIERRAALIQLQRLDFIRQHKLKVERAHAYGSRYARHPVTGEAIWLEISMIEAGH